MSDQIGGDIQDQKDIEREHKYIESSLADLNSSSINMLMASSLMNIENQNDEQDKQKQTRADDEKKKSKKSKKQKSHSPSDSKNDKQKQDKDKEKDHKEKDKEREKDGQDKEKQIEKSKDKDKEREKEKQEQSSRRSKEKNKQKERSSSEERRKNKKHKSKSKSKSPDSKSSKSRDRDKKQDQKRRSHNKKKHESSRSKSANKHKAKTSRKKRSRSSSSSQSSENQQEGNKTDPQYQVNAQMQLSNQNALIQLNQLGPDRKPHHQHRPIVQTNPVLTQKLKGLTLEELNKFHTLGMRSGNPIPPSQQLQPIYKYARRLYVGNIPHLIAPEFLTEWLYRSLEEAEGLLEAGNPIIETQIEQNCQYAFIQLRSLEETSAMLQLDGIMLWSQNLRIKRPTEYEKNQQIMGTRPIPELNLVQLQKLGIYVIKSKVEDSANKLFLANLPNNLEDGQIIEMLDLRKYGTLRSFHLVKDGGSQQSKGYAFLEYGNQEQTQNAIVSLNNLIFAGRTLVCQRSGQQDTKIEGNTSIMDPAISSVKYDQEFFQMLGQKLVQGQVEQN